MNARHSSVATRAAAVRTARTTITLRRRGALGVAGAAVFAAASLGLTATAFAKKGVDDNGKDACTSVACGTGSLKLEGGNHSGNRLGLEAEVDSNTPGQDRTVTPTNNGTAVWTATRIMVRHDKGADTTRSDDRAGDDKGADTTRSDDRAGDDKGADSTVR